MKKPFLGLVTSKQCSDLLLRWAHLFLPLIFFCMQLLITDKCSVHETSERLCHSASLCSTKSMVYIITMNIVSMNTNFPGKGRHEFVMKRNCTHVLCIKFSNMAYCKSIYPRMVMKLLTC